MTSEATPELGDIKDVIHVRGSGGYCALCGSNQSFHRADDAVNHYIQEHGYRLLRIGTESGGLGTEYVLGSIEIHPRAPSKYAGLESK